MLFNSYVFLGFLPLSLCGYYWTNKHFASRKPSLLFLIAVSFVFYGFFNWNYLFILMCSILVNWFVVVFMRSCLNELFRKYIVVLGILFNVILIFYFKYYDFFIETVNAIFHLNVNLRNILLPLGISFFTFQQISFVVDSYKHETDDYNLIEYIAFVSFFPQLIAGPIVMHNEMIPQFRNDVTRKVHWENISNGLCFFILGLGKKVLVADIFGSAVDWGYSNVDAVSSIDAMIIIISYAIQIYFDFSGYCDMASGIAFMFNFKLPINFDSPYKSQSIIEFWGKWHMTLTRFLRQYIYFPLGGSRVGTVHTYINIMIVFLISGIWHGANWTFIIWGCLHGGVNCLNRMFESQWERLNPVFRWHITFSFISYAWVIFRADSMSQALNIIWKSLNFRQLAISPQLIECFNTTEVILIKYFVDRLSLFQTVVSEYYINGFVVFVWIFIVMFIIMNTENNQKRKMGFYPTGMALLFILEIFSLSGVSNFLYFNF